MTPQLVQLQRDVAELLAFMKAIMSSATIPFDVEKAFVGRLSKTFTALNATTLAGLNSAPLTAITAPTGGTTQDAEARTAINSIITRLEDLGLVNDN